MEAPLSPKKKVSSRTGKITYDKKARAAYIYLVDKIIDGEVAKTKEDTFLVLIDRDKNGKALGIEILGIDL